jgi:hypothetical protein
VLLQRRTGVESRPMPFSPSHITWWGWLLCAVGAGVVSSISANYADKEHRFAGYVVARITGIQGFIFGVIGIIKWIWGS